jgi:hypothetical protein
VARFGLEARDDLFNRSAQDVWGDECDLILSASAARTYNRQGDSGDSGKRKSHDGGLLIHSAERRDLWAPVATGRGQSDAFSIFVSIARRRSYTPEVLASESIYFRRSIP